MDAEATICNDNRVVLYVWYDNEFGYSRRVVRVMEDMVGQPAGLPALSVAVVSRNGSPAPVSRFWRAGSSVNPARLSGR